MSGQRKGPTPPRRVKDPELDDLQRRLAEQRRHLEERTGLYDPGAEAVLHQRIAELQRAREEVSLEAVAHHDHPERREVGAHVDTWSDGGDLGHLTLGGLRGAADDVLTRLETARANGRRP